MNQLVMVVDDDDDIRETLCELLVDEGYRAIGMANGHRALEYLEGQGEAPQLILLDLMMPVMDGWTFRAEQQRRPGLSGIPVVVITAAGAAQAATVDCARVIEKPLRIEHVLSAVEQLT